MTWEQRMEKLLKDVIRRVQEDTVVKLPDTHRFQPIGCGLRIPDTEYLAYIIVQCDALDRHGRRVCVRVLEEGTDRAYEQIFPAMTSSEIREFLSEPQAYVQIRQAVDELWAKVQAQ